MRMRSSTGAKRPAPCAATWTGNRRTARRGQATARARRGRARQNHASAPKRAIIKAGSHRTGSRSAARLAATPPIPATGIHRKKRRSSTSRARAFGERAAPVRRPAAARVKPAAAARAPVRAGVAIGSDYRQPDLGERQSIWLGRVQTIYTVLQRAFFGPTWRAVDRAASALDLGFLGRRRFPCENRHLGLLDFLGFPWILSSTPRRNSRD